MSNKVWNVTQLDSFIKDKLCNDYILQNITVQGEIMNLRIPSSGHWYFSLKDKNAQIKCTMFRYANQKVSFKPENGDLVLATGSIDFYTVGGEITFNIKSLEISGIGNFYVQFEQTKRKLEPLGYFDEKHKKAIPVYPNTITVVAGADTAGLRDVQITLAKRWPVELRVVPAIVQGKEAVGSIIAALKKADSQNSDVILLVRGGGSIDELWCFNDENIAKTIYNCKTPVITGIGHEIDTTIADLVADKRAATPTAAAVAATPEAGKIIEKLETYQQNLARIVQSKIDGYQQFTDGCTYRLQGYLTTLQKQETRINKIENQMIIDLNRKVQSYQHQVSLLENKITNNTKNLLDKNQNKLAYQVSLLDSLSPLKTIARGYIISKQDDKVIKKASEIDYQKEISLTYQDGTITALPQKKGE